MSVSRALIFHYKRRSSIDALCKAGRFGPSKRVRLCNYSKSSKYSSHDQFGLRPVKNIEPPESSRSWGWGAYMIPAALLGFAGLVTFIHYNDERRAVLKGQGTNTMRSNVEGPIIGGPFTLVDTDNNIVTERSLRGKWTLLYFGYTSSPDVGPDQLHIMAKAIAALDSEDNLKVVPVFVTIDPQRDNPPQLRAYLKEFDPRIVGLTGPVSAIRQMAQEYRVFFKKIEEEGDDYLVESSHNIYLLNPNMEVVRCFGVEYNTDELSKAILKELNKGFEMQNPPSDMIR